MTIAPARAFSLENEIKNGEAGIQQGFKRTIPITTQQVIQTGNQGAKSQTDK
jgi:hypothetical protein